MSPTVSASVGNRLRERGGTGGDGANGAGYDQREPRDGDLHGKCRRARMYVVDDAAACGSHCSVSENQSFYSTPAVWIATAPLPPPPRSRVVSVVQRKVQKKLAECVRSCDNSVLSVLLASAETSPDI